MGCHDHQGAEELLQACFALHLDMGEEERKKTHNWVCSPKIHNLVSTIFGLLALLIHPHNLLVSLLSCACLHIHLLLLITVACSNHQLLNKNVPCALLSPYWYHGTNPVLGGYLNPLQIPSWYQPGYIGI